MIAEWLRKLKATFREYLGLTMIMNDWFDTLYEGLAYCDFDNEDYTEEEMMALFYRSLESQGNLYLGLLERTR